MQSLPHTCFRCDTPLTDRQRRYCSKQCKTLSLEAFGTIARPNDWLTGENTSFDPEDFAFGDYDPADDVPPRHRSASPHGRPLSISHDRRGPSHSSNLASSMFRHCGLAAPGRPDSRLVQMTRICLALRGTARAMGGPHAEFSVRSKPYAFYLQNRKGDGIVGACFKQPRGGADVLLEYDPTQFYRPPVVGTLGWIGLRLDTGNPDWDCVKELASQAYARVVRRAQRMA